MMLSPEAMFKHTLTSQAEKDRRLAQEIAQAAVLTIGEAYRSPHVREAAMRAASMALGLEPHEEPQPDTKLRLIDQSSTEREQ